MTRSDVKQGPDMAWAPRARGDAEINAQKPSLNGKVVFSGKVDLLERQHFGWHVVASVGAVGRFKGVKSGQAVAKQTKCSPARSLLSSFSRATALCRRVMRSGEGAGVDCFALLFLCDRPRAPAIDVRGEWVNTTGLRHGARSNARDGLRAAGRMCLEGRDRDPCRFYLDPAIEGCSSLIRACSTGEGATVLCATGPRSQLVRPSDCGALRQAPPASYYVVGRIVEATLSA